MEDNNTIKEIRNNQWLLSRFIYLKDNHFPDVKFDTIFIKFGTKARTRLGSIKQNLKNNKITITITGHFIDPRVPTEVIDAVIAHEMCHYTHGFCSNLPKKYKYPHLGGAVEKEMISRGLGTILSFQEKWIKNNWKSIAGTTQRKVRITKGQRSILEYLFK